MKCVSLFAGIGGFDLALTRLGHEIVYANEWDKYAAQTYEKNFSNIKHTSSCNQNGGDESNTSRSDGKGGWSCSNGHVDTRDITTVPTSDIPDHDLLVGGFPCQAFSIAGKRRGFDETRGTLFFEIARILKDKKPRYFLLENVKGLLSHDAGRTFKTIIATLTELGYDLQWQVVNSKDFGVPQNRERVFIIGHLRGQPRPKVFPIGGSNEVGNGEGQIANTLTSNYWKGAAASRPMVGTLRTHKDGQGFREIKSGLSPTIPARAREDGSGQPVIMEDFYPNRIREFNESPTLRGERNGLKVRQDMSIRRLTPVECERLQGFPDGWTEGVSDTQRYKQLGNAVTVNVVEEIVRRLSST